MIRIRSILTIDTASHHGGIPKDVAALVGVISASIGCFLLRSIVNTEDSMRPLRRLDSLVRSQSVSGPNGPTDTTSRSLTGRLLKLDSKKSKILANKIEKIESGTLSKLRGMEK
jgi:hypothetical protein